MKRKRCLALLLALVLVISLTQFPAFCDTESQSGHPQPDITISGSSTFNQGGSFSFDITSDMGGSLSVSVGGLAAMAVESQPIKANTPFTVNIPAMPDVSSSDIVVMVRPDNPVNVDPAKAAVTGVKVFAVTADVSAGMGAPAMSSASEISKIMGTSAPVSWTSLVFGQSVENNGYPAASASNTTYNPNNTLAIDQTGNITLSSRSDKGKIQSASDGINYYYTQIDSASNFRISATMNVSAMNINNQCAAGIMVRDAFGSSTTPNDGASKMLMGGWLQNSTTGATSSDANVANWHAYRNVTSVSKSATINMKTGVDYRVEIVKIGSNYSISLSSGNRKDSVTTISSTLPNISGTNLYVGPFTSRNATATFRNLNFEVLDASNTPVSLAVTTPAASVFFANTSPDWSDMAVTCTTTAPGSQYIVPAADYFISGYDNVNPGTRDATVYYRGASATFGYTVNYDYTVSMYVSIPPLKSTYALGEVFDRTGLEIRSNNSSGTQTVMTEGAAQGNYTLNIPAFTTAGTIPITVTRSGANTGGSDPLTVTFDVMVKNVTVADLEISQPPIKTSYYVNDSTYDGSGTVVANKSLLSGIIVKAILSDGSKEVISMDTGSGAGYTVNYTTPRTSFVSAAGTSIVTLSYAGMSKDVPFTIVPLAMSKLVATTYPKTTYNIGDALDLTGMVVNVQNNDGTFSPPLTAADFNVITTAVDMSTEGLYNITLEGIGTYAGLTGTVPVSVRVPQDYTTGWQHVTFGQSASLGSNNVCTVTPEGNSGSAVSGTTIDLNTMNGKGKVADGHDGINYYYHRLNKDDNFKLTADVTVLTFSNPDGVTAIYGQEAFGLMARDRIAADGDDSVWPSSMFMAGARGSTSWNALYRDNRMEYINGVTATNQNMPAATSSGTINPFHRLGQSGTGITNTSTITIERRNNNWSATIKQGANFRTYSINNDIPLNYYDPDYIYVGFFTARNAHIQFSNVSLTVTSSAADKPGPVIAQDPIVPALTIRSAAATTSKDYNLIYTSNAEGTANIYKNSTLVATQPVIANVPMRQPMTLGDAGSTNGIIVEFFPSTSRQYSSYDRITSSISVAVNQGFNELYVSPAGSGSGQTRSTPTTFADAVSKLAPGGIIHLLPGNYGALTLPRYNDGVASAYKKVVGEAGVKATSLSVQANFWHVKNFEVSGGSVSISGNDNVIEMISQHGSTGAGVQISRGDAATQPSLAYWPSRNVLLNCEAYDNRDNAENDADGFAAKLTSGRDNKFIGCVSHHNIDDGWDLYAKSVPIGPSVLDHCIAYSNGHTLTVPDTTGGDGNGFKLGGEGVPVAHSISNSIAFSNKSEGFTSNSNPILTATNNVSFDNGAANINFSSYGNVPQRGYVVNNFYSYRRDTAASTSQDVIESITGSAIVSSDGRKQYTTVPHSIYLWNSTAGVATNDLGRTVTDAFFVNLTKPSDYQTTSPSAFTRDTDVTNTVPSETYLQNILLADFLKLTTLAKDHTRLYDVAFDPSGGVIVTGNTTASAIYDDAKGKAVVTEIPVVSRTNYTFAGWFTGVNGGGTQFTSDTAVNASLVVYAKWTANPINNVTDNSSNGNSNSSGGKYTQILDSSGNMSTSVHIELNSGTGIASIGLDAASLTGAFDKSKTDGDGKRTIVANIPKIDGAKAYELVMPVSFLTSGDATKLIETKTEKGSVTVSGDMLPAVNMAAAQKVSLTIATADTSKLTADVKNQINGRPVIELTLMIDGKQTAWRNENSSVTVAIPYTPTAGELKDPEHITVWYLDGSGNAVAVPSGRYDPTTGTVVFKTTHFSKYAVAFVQKTFTDISNYSWAKKQIEVLASKGIIQASGTAFNPPVNITRADYLAMLIKTLGISADFTGNFDDIKAGDSYYKEIGIAKKLGIAKGTGNNKFDPNAAISRQEMMVLTARTLETFKKQKATGTSAALDKFKDKADISKYAVESIATLVKEGLIEGSGGKVNPLAKTSRAEAAVFLYRIYNKYSLKGF